MRDWYSKCTRLIHLDWKCPEFSSPGAQTPRHFFQSADILINIEGIIVTWVYSKNTKKISGTGFFPASSPANNTWVTETSSCLRFCIDKLASTVMSSVFVSSARVFRRGENGSGKQMWHEWQETSVQGERREGQCPPSLTCLPPSKLQTNLIQQQFVVLLFPSFSWQSIMVSSF